MALLQSKETKRLAKLYGNWKHVERKVTKTIEEDPSLGKMARAETKAELVKLPRCVSKAHSTWLESQLHNVQMQWDSSHADQQP